MNCFNTTFIVDYRSGDEATIGYLEEYSNEAFYVAD